MDNLLGKQPSVVKRSRWSSTWHGTMLALVVAVMMVQTEKWRADVMGQHRDDMAPAMRLVRSDALLVHAWARRAERWLSSSSGKGQPFLRRPRVLSQVRDEGEAASNWRDTVPRREWTTHTHVVLHSLSSRRWSLARPPSGSRIVTVLPYRSSTWQSLHVASLGVPLASLDPLEDTLRNRSWAYHDSVPALP